MRKKIIAGNWKMNKTVAESVTLASELMEGLKKKSLPESDIVICPTFLALDRVYGVVKGSPVKLGAQDVHWEDQGAFTSKISAAMLTAVGVEYVIIGHSELRLFFSETNENVNRKAKKLLSKNLIPIVCVGETLSQRETGATEIVISSQVREGFAGISPEGAAKCVIAYEPVWAIGTGRNATDGQAQDVHRFIRSLLTELYGQSVAETVRIQYGGSMKPENAAGLLAQPDVDGGLIGGASLKAETFIGILIAQQ